MKRILKLLSLTLVVMACLTSCEDDDFALVFPTFKGFSIENSTLHPGDTLRINGFVKKSGKYLYKVKYNWYMEVDTVSADGKQSKMELHYGIQSSSAHRISLNDNPKAYFVIPQNVVTDTEPQTFKFEFQVDYEHAAKGTPIPHESEPDPGYLGGVFYHKVLSDLYSQTTNSFKASVTIK